MIAVAVVATGLAEDPGAGLHRPVGEISWYVPGQPLAEGSSSLDAERRR